MHLRQNIQAKRNHFLLSDSVQLLAPERDHSIDGTSGLSKAQKRRRRRQLLAANRYPSSNWRTYKKADSGNPCWMAARCFNNQVPPVIKNLQSAKLVYFNGAKDPLSNFWPVHLTVRGKTYKSLEHAYQSRKASFLGNLKIQTAIEQAHSASRAKLLSKALKPTPAQQVTWLENRVAIMKELLEHKHHQCDAFRAKLSENSQAYFLETTTDDFWACGAMRYQITPRNRLPGGNNAMGRLLTELSRTKTLRNSHK